MDRSGEGGAFASIAWMSSSSFAMAPACRRCDSDSGISSSERIVAWKAARLAR